MEDLPPYDFDQTTAGWSSLDQEGKYLEAAEAIELYVHKNLDSIANQSKVSVQTMFFHAGQEYAMAGPEQYQKAIAMMKNSYKKDLSWNMYVDGSIAFLSGNALMLEESAESLFLFSIQNSDLAANAELLKSFAVGLSQGSTYAKVYQLL
jgi:hypothetical protein